MKKTGTEKTAAPARKVGAPPLTKSERFNASLARTADRRRRKMQKLKDAGLTLEEIGRRFGGISRQRVKFILAREPYKVGS